jgi:hypothetical protein
LAAIEFFLAMATDPASGLNRSTAVQFRRKAHGSVRVQTGHKHFGVFVGLFLVSVFIPR